jgi:hypothetical protein
MSRKAIMASSSLGIAKKSLGDLRLPVSVYSIVVNTKISALLLTQHFLVGKKNKPCPFYKHLWVIAQLKMYKGLV